MITPCNPGTYAQRPPPFSNPLASNYEPVLYTAISLSLKK